MVLLHFYRLKILRWCRSQWVLRRHVTKERLLRIFLFRFFNITSWYCDWNADLLVPHCVEAKAQGDKSQSVGAQLCPADLRIGWSERCPEPQALGAGLVRPGLMGLMLWGLVCVTLKARITVQEIITVQKSLSIIVCHDVFVYFVVLLTMPWQFIPEPQVRILSLCKAQGKI